MTAVEDMAERHARQLARYAELSLSMAEDVHAAALAADDPDRKARLANGFHKLGRAMRQSIALEARFVRDRAADQRAAGADAAEAARAAVRRRRDQVRAAVERQIYCELEPGEAPAWLADLDERLEEEALYDGFDDETVEDHIARLGADLGLTGETVRDYTPRALRPRLVAPSRHAPDRFGAFADLLGDDEDDAEDEDDEADDADDDEDEGEPDVPAQAPPLEPAAPVMPTSAPPDPEPDVEPDPRPSQVHPPTPPPRPPPDPEPYLLPWERHPDSRFPGGSGY